MAITTSRVAPGAAVELIELLLVDIATGAVSTLPAAGPDDHTATWSPDGTRVAFISARRGASQVVVARPDDAAPRMVTSLAGAASGPVGWSPDGARLVLEATRGRGIDHDSPYRVTRAVQWADGIGALDDPPQLLAVDSGTGVAHQLTDDEWRWSLPRWSPDGRTVAARASHDPSGRRRGMHVRLVDTVTGRITEPDVPAGFATVPIWLADGRLVVLSVQPEGRPFGAQAQLHLVGLDGTVQPLHDRAPFALGGDVYADNASVLCVEYESAIVAATADGAQRLFVRHHDGGRMGISRVTIPLGDQPGPDDWTIVIDGPRAATPLGVAGGELIATDQSAERPPQLVAIDLVGERPEASRLRRVGDRLFDTPEPITADVRRFRITVGEDASLPSAAGAPGAPGAPGARRVEAWLLVPPGAREPLPTVVMIHGGPNAAFAENPVTDLLSMYGTSDIGATFLPGHLGATPVDDPSAYLCWSPILYAHRCTTPMLFVVGGDDRRCPPTQSFEMHRALHAHGTPSEVLVLPGEAQEGTTYGSPAARLAHDDALVEWMERWLLGRGVPP